MESLKGGRHTFFSYFHRHKDVSAAAKDITPISWGDPAEPESVGSHATFWVSYLAPLLAACMSQNWALANHLEWQELRFPAAPVTKIGAGSRAVILWFTPCRRELCEECFPVTWQPSGEALLPWDLSPNGKGSVCVLLSMVKNER